jgi:gentisate 1,2-dioxygenase
MKNANNSDTNKELIKFNNFKWATVETVVYKKCSINDTTFYNVERQNIITKNDLSFEVRYFECGKNGFTTLEKHQHTHVVMIARGRGKVIIEDKIFDASPFDYFIISEWRPHQLINVSDEPFGFFCTVNSERDKYTLLSEKEISRLIRNIEIAEYIRIPEGYRKS